MSERIVIAGCRGRMGAMLMERLSRSAAFQPVGLDLPYDEEDMEQACRGARVVLLCIPATAIAGTVEKLRPFMEPSTILAFVESLFHSFCCVTFRATAEEHDMAEARIQGMNFITSAVYFAMTAEDPALLPYITPSFLRRMNSTEKQLMEDGPLFTWLFEANPHSQAMVRQYRNLLSLAAAGDVDLILHKAQWWWKDGEEKRKLHEEARKVALQSARAGLKKGMKS